MIANSVFNVVNPEVVIPARPKQCKLLGAKVKLEHVEGVCTTVGQQNVWPWCLIEDASGREHHAFIRDLKRENIEFPDEAQPYKAVTRRIGYGLIEDCYSLLTVPFSDLTHAEPEEYERAA